MNIYNSVKGITSERERNQTNYLFILREMDDIHTFKGYLREYKGKGILSTYLYG